MPRQAEVTRDIRADLEHYRKNKEKIEKLDAKIEKLKDVDIVETCTNEQFRKQVRRVYGLPPTSEVRKLKAERKELWHITAMTEQFVSMLEDNDTREIFRLKYLEGEKRPTYKEISAALDGRLQPESVRKIIQRAFKKFVRTS